MTVNEYQKLAARTINPGLSKSETERHALFGLAAETGEILALYQKELQGHPISGEDVKKEAVDVAGMLCDLCTVYGWDFEEVLKMNIEKLMVRYPEGFDPERSLHREEDIEGRFRKDR